MLHRLQNNKIKLLSLVMLIISSVLSGQIYTEEQENINNYINQIENTSEQSDSLLLRMDSIIINVRRTKNKLITISHFANSNSDLMMNFFFKEDSLVLVKVSEQSKNFNEVSRSSVYYISNNRISSRYHGGTVRASIIVPANVDHCEFYGYNKTFSSAFLEQYMAELLIDIKLQPFSAWIDNGKKSGLSDNKKN